MKRKTIIWLFIALMFIVSGSGIFLVTLANNNWGNQGNDVNMYVCEACDYANTLNNKNFNKGLKELRDWLPF